MSGGRTLTTLGDLVFHVRDHWTGRKAFLSIDRERRRQTLSAGDFVDSVHCLAIALDHAGLAQGDRVAIFSENSPEWHVVEFACQLVGAVTVPIYPSLPAEQVAFIVKNSGCRWLFFRSAAQRKIIEQVAQGLSAPMRLIAMEDDRAGMLTAQSLTPLLGAGAEHQSAVPIELFRGRRESSDAASVVYTAGTTGEPKGVVLTHRNLIANFQACGRIFTAGPGDRALSFLPLANPFERTLCNFLLLSGASIHYAQRIEHLPRLLTSVRPTVLSSLPDVYAQARRRELERVERVGGLGRSLFDRALNVGASLRATRRNGFGGPVLRLQRRLVGRSARRELAGRFGGHLRLAISCGAPLRGEVADFFDTFGMPITSLYGLTEASPVVTAVNRPGDGSRYAAGRPMPGVDVRLADDGELMVRGPGVMAGYWQDEETTAETIDSGWLATGDLGETEPDGSIAIVGRSRDRFELASGKRVSPEPIEQLLTASELVDQALVVGDTMPHVAALIVPELSLFATRYGLSDPHAIAADPRARRALQEVVGEVNRALTPAQRVRRWDTLEEPFSLEAGELGPSLTLRRRVLLARHAERIRELYRNDSSDE